MLTAVEAVTSVSQWQLALFNAWRRGGGGGLKGGKAAIHRLASCVTCTYVNYKLPRCVL